MLDIVLDGNKGTEFCGKQYPVFIIEKQPLYGWGMYRRLAQQIVTDYAQEKAVVLLNHDDKFSINKLSIALFVAALQIENNLELAVFKVDDFVAARKAYEPYLSLTIALKFALFMLHDTPHQIYKNIEGMGYLGLNIKHDFSQNKLILDYVGADDALYLETQTDNVADALIYAAVLKTLALAKIKAKYHIEMVLNETNYPIDTDYLIGQVLRKVSVWLKS